jgi:hypothetical protein
VTVTDNDRYLLDDAFSKFKGEHPEVSEDAVRLSYERASFYDGLGSIEPRSAFPQGRFLKFFKDGIRLQVPC